jgi:hypothetical protein
MVLSSIVTVAVRAATFAQLPDRFISRVAALELPDVWTACLPMQLDPRRGSVP